MHNKAEQHLKERMSKAERRNEEEEDVLETVAKHRLRFVHVRAFDHATMQLRHKGGCTVAYTLPPRKGDSLIEVAVALVHHNDAFCKRTGRFVVCRNWTAGATLSLRVPKNATPATFLKAMFSVMVN